MPSIAGYRLDDEVVCFTCACASLSGREPFAGEEDALGRPFVPIYSTDTASLTCTTCRRAFTIIPLWDGS